MYYYEVAVPAPTQEHLTYSSELPLERGQLVELQLRRKKTKGLIIKETSKPDFETKPLGESLDFKLNESHLKWLEWIAQYYMYPPGLVLHSIFPPLKKKPIKEKEPPLFEPLKKDLTPAQQKSLEELLPLNGFKAQLLHGVTGAGKTEIYLELFEEVVFKQKKQGLFLLPEIALTPQLERRFKERFGDLVTTYHSQLTPRQKTNAWHSFMDQEKKILIGPRSALFCPSENLGLIVVDEEHESSFKQEEKFLYNARDAALKLSQIKNIPIVLGSATPSLETFKNVNAKKINYVRLKEKVFEQDPPKINLVDLTKEKDLDLFWLSPQLKSAIENHLARKKQIALFLNRRGWASFIQCYACGKDFKCPNCDISLTLHHKQDLFCHYCGYGEKVPEACPDCSEEQIKKVGLGTEQVYEEMSALFPQARVLKFDRDEIQTKNQLAEAISLIEKHEVDIIIGTQMIAKGLDFTNLTLMGVLDADQSFSFPDFRSTEKSIQQLNQVLGRVGRRKGQAAEVLIQTRSPEHAVFQNLDESKFEDFAQDQLKRREIYSYPPFSRMVAFLIKSKSKQTGFKLSERLTHMCQSLKQSWPTFEPVSVLGPCTAPIEKIRNEYRHQVILKFPNQLPHSNFVQESLKAIGKLPPQTKISINVDPIDLM